MSTESGVSLPRGQALWRLNERGLLALRQEPGHPIYSADAHFALEAAIRNGWWQPRARTVRRVSDEALADWIENYRPKLAPTREVIGENGHKAV